MATFYDQNRSFYRSEFNPRQKIALLSQWDQTLQRSKSQGDDKIF